MAKSSSRSRTKSGAPARAPGSIRSLTIADLQAELRRRQAAGKPLLARRARTAEKLARLDAELASLGVAAGDAVVSRGRRGPRGPRPSNSLSLVEALKKAMTGKVLTVGEAAQAVLAMGYKTNSKNFRTVVNQTLLVNKSSFKSPERGHYTAK